MKKILSETEKQKNDAWSFIRCQVKAQKLMRKHFKSIDGVEAICNDKTIHIYGGVVMLAELAGLDYRREDWNGNKSCNSNWDMVYFTYEGYTFFELVSKDTVYDYEPVQIDIQ